MNILALDTSTNNFSLAVFTNSKTLMKSYKIEDNYSEVIILKIDELLKEVMLNLNDVDIIAYNQGPGSFTGLRIGLSVVMGLAYGGNIQVIPIPRFYMFVECAINLTKSRQMIIGIDAKLKQLYFAGVDSHTLKYTIEPQLTYPQDILVSNLNDTVFIGDGLVNYYNTLPQEIREVCDIDRLHANNNAIVPNATNMITLVNKKQLPSIPVDKLDLLYLRNKIALNIKEQQKLRQQ